MFKKKCEKSKELEKYIYLLENEKSHLEGEIKTIERKMNRQANVYLEPIRNIINILDYDYTSEQKLDYIKTQIENFMREKNLKIYKPNVGEVHDKKFVIVDEIVKTSKKEDEDKIEFVLSVGIMNDKGILVPARVRIYKGE